MTNEQPESPDSSGNTQEHDKRTKPEKKNPAEENSWDRSQFVVPAEEGKTRFHDFDLPDPVMHAISDLGFLYCTPIQAEILPSTLAGEDAFGKAQTGTGKTAAFLITIITHLIENPLKTAQPEKGTPRVLILAPTRELALQITEEGHQLAKYTDLNIISIFGGMDYQKQQNQLNARPVDIIVATPGRLLDFHRRRILTLKYIETLIIDEGDRMLDMGFIPDVRKIIQATPHKENRQTMLFSATLSESIRRLAASWTLNPATVEIEPEQIAAESVDQIVYIVTERQKFALLYNIIAKQNLERVMVFCNRKDQVRRLTDMLGKYGIRSSMLTGDVPQNKRVRRLDDFKAGKIRVLVATDVVARGIHIEGMDHVINFTLPHDPEDYVHRIGRTGRAGATGTSVSFADEEDSFYLPAIEDFMERKLACIEPDDQWLVMPQPIGPKKQGKRKRKRRRKSPGGNDSPSGD